MTERKLQIESMLMALSKDKSKLVRAAVAENPNTSAYRCQSWQRVESNNG
jgi:hypothetical protein